MTHQNKNFIENKVLGFLSKYGQIMLVCVVMIVLSLMIIPVEPGFLDALLALNITGGLIVLMLAISINHPMKLSSFPSLLLICTLFRLGLNISSTRLILSRGEAGDIINTFGYFVTEGNFIVGIIIFFVLLVIQFIVVAKGAERVAEVAARFTLDALPGKQMSIDADLRAGIITSEEAATRRNDLIKESKLYGSMDGAMKFVKGDTIAGFVITFINIIGGLIIGVFTHGLDIGVAAQKYSVLTIGDGLVSQIPALLISLAAGFIVTRVADDKNQMSLGSEIGSQIFMQPKALLVVSGMALIIGFIPGFPFIFFAIVSVVLASFSGMILWRQKKAHREVSSVEMLHTDYEVASHDLGYAVPLMVELSPKMYHDFLHDDRWRACFHQHYPNLKTQLSKRMGVPIPDVKISVNDDLAHDRYVIKIYEVPVDEGFLSPEHCVVRDDTNFANKTTIMNSNNVQSSHTVHGSSVMLFELKKQQELVEQGVKAVSPEEMFLKHLAKTVIKHASDFVGIQEVRDILSNVEKYHPELVREVIPRLLSVQKLTDVIKRLVDEHVSVKDFRMILETLTVSHPEDKNTVDLTELVRIGLKRQITHRYAGRTGKLVCFCLEPDIEEEIAKNISKSGNDCFLTLAPDRISHINQAIQLVYRQHGLLPKHAVILTRQDIRRYVRKMIELDMPDLAVLSYQELEPTLMIDQRDTISLNYPEFNMKAS